MFGFSLPKLLFTALLIGAVWIGFRMLSRRRNTASDDPTSNAVRCPRCDSFVLEESAENCGKQDCPYAR